MSKVVLGKGLGALIPAEDTERGETKAFRMIPLNQIAPNPMQPRTEFEEEQLLELAQSFKKDGILQPLVVKKGEAGYIIIAGERRFRAAGLADLEQVPAFVMDDVDDARMLELALIENIHRQDLNPIETAQAYRRLIDECGLTQNDLAERVGKSRAAVANQLRLLGLPEKVRAMLRAGQLTEGHARAILSLDNEEQMLQMAAQIVSDALTVRDVEKKTSPKGKRGRRAERQPDPGLAEMENELKQILGTSVKITSGAKAGKIEIEYYNDDDLTRLWDLFKRIQQ